jgi:hypothetical protein
LNARRNYADTSPKRHHTDLRHHDQQRDDLGIVPGSA